MVLKGRRVNDITMIQSNLWDTLAKRPTTHSTKRSEWWCNHRAHCILSQKDYTERDKTNQLGLVVMEK